MRGTLDASYLYIREPSSYVNRTVDITPGLLVDLDSEGRILGIEKIAGEITYDDLKAVIHSINT